MIATVQVRCCSRLIFSPPSKLWCFSFALNIRRPRVESSAKLTSMHIYLDTCWLQRPLDDQTQPRIRVETEAVFAILASVQHGIIALLTSEALEFEVSHTPDEHRRREATAILTLASERLLLNDDCENLAESFAQSGLSAIDALHLALAATAGADYFVTTDDKLLRRAKSIPDLTVTPISLLGLVSEISQ